MTDLHDWRTASGETSDMPPDWVVDARLQAGSPVAITWAGPAADAREATRTARADCLAALRVTAALCHVPDAIGPRAKLILTRPKRAYDLFGETAVQIGRGAISHLSHAWPPVPRMPGDRVDAIAHATLMAAAPRARLEPGSTLSLSYPVPHDPDLGNPPAALVQISVTLPSRADSVALDGPLRTAVIALAIAGQLGTHREHAPQDSPVVPASATLRAALKAQMAERAPHRAALVASFLREVGLSEAAQAFASTYGSPA